jgi:hypothetical protein
MIGAEFVYCLSHSPAAQLQFDSVVIMATAQSEHLVQGKHLAKSFSAGCEALL